MAPPPDLSTSTVASTLTTAQPGQSETVTWTVTNAGATPATGSWTDSVYLSLNGQVAGATLLGTMDHSGGLAPGSSYNGTLNTPLPSSLADGTYQVIVVADSGDAVDADPDRTNNQSSASQSLSFGHVNLVPTITAAPSASTSGTTLVVQWTTTNDGSVPTLAGWVDRAYLSTTDQVTASSLLIGEVSIQGPLATGQDVSSSASVLIPLGDSGIYHVIVVANATDQLNEPNGTANTTSQPITITMAPYADLAVSNVQAPSQTIGDPAYPTISWTVTNVGTGSGRDLELDRRRDCLAHRQRR